MLNGASTKICNTLYSQKRVSWVEERGRLSDRPLVVADVRAHGGARSAPCLLCGHEPRLAGGIRGLLLRRRRDVLGVLEFLGHGGLLQGPRPREAGRPGESRGTSRWSGQACPAGRSSGCLLFLTGGAAARPRRRGPSPGSWRRRRAALCRGGNLAIRAATGPDQVPGPGPAPLRQGPGRGRRPARRPGRPGAALGVRAGGLPGAPEPAEVPRSLLRADGRSVYQLHGGVRYATHAQLSVEERVQLPAADLDPSGRARLSYQQAAALFSGASGGATLHQLRHFVPA